MEKRYDSDVIKIMIQEAKEVQMDLENFTESLLREFPNTTLMEAQHVYFLLRMGSLQNQVEQLNHDIELIKIGHEL